MHPQAYDYVRRHAGARPDVGLRVLDIGGQDMNGSVRPHFEPGLDAERFPHATYQALDIAAGKGVDIVADAATWRRPTGELPFDVVVCAEVFEHTPAWRDIVHTAYDSLRPGGRFIATMAGPGRPPHSGRRASLEIDPDEHYENVDPGDLDTACRAAGFVDVIVDVAGGSTAGHRRTEDVRVTARRPVAVHVLSSIMGGYDTRVLGHAHQDRALGQQNGSFVLVTDADEVSVDQQASGRWYPQLATQTGGELAQVGDDPRQQARFPKFLPHDYPPDWFAEGDLVVWIDGRLEMLSPRYVATVVEAFGDADYAAWDHPTCRTMAQQAVVCMRDMPMKYDQDALIDHYMACEGENDTGLPGYDRVWQLTTMVTRLNDRTFKVGEDVLNAMEAYPRSIDQAEFPYAARRHAASVVSLPGGMGGFWQHHSDGYFTLHPHKDGT